MVSLTTNFNQIADFIMNDLDNQLPYLRLKSVSAQNTGIDETVDYLVKKNLSHWVLK